MSHPRRFCIIGAGAIGGFTGARLALGGEDVTFIARGRNLEAIAAGGLRVRHADGREERATSVRATDSWESAGEFDVVLVALKAYQLPEVAHRIEGLCHAGTIVVPMQNGIPFWYFHGHGGAHAGRTVESVDPGGRIRDAIPAHRIVGCVVYVAAEHIAPGEVRHIANNRFQLGEIAGPNGERVQALADAFTRSGLQPTLFDDIRAETWLKVWGNVSFNPISALTRSTLSHICDDPHGYALAAQMMREAQQVAAGFGVTFRITLEKRIEGAARVGAHKTSMLQDLEAGRELEIDALVGSVIELGEVAGVQTPTIRAVYNAVKLLSAGSAPVRLPPADPGRR